LFSTPPETIEPTNASLLTLPLTPAQGTIDTDTLLRGDQVTRDAKTEVLTILRTDEPADLAEKPIAKPTSPIVIESAFVLPLTPPEKETLKAEGQATFKPEKPAAYIDPQPSLLKKGKYGRLPVISPTGERSWQAYASPIDPLSKDRPIVALIIGGMGISENSTNYAITQLPPAVTLAFAPYGNGLQRWMDRARARGHETLIELPMEPFDYPNNDPGPYTLLSKSEPAKNIDRLHWLLTRGSGYVGVTNYQGARFVTDAKALEPIFTDLQERGLMYVDHPSVRRSKTQEMALAVDMPLSQGSSQIDPKLNKHAIDEALLRLEEQAKREGVAVGFGSGFPLTIDRIDAWSKKLEERGVTLVPVSATVSARYKLQ
ncbi:MAG: divergent polysaccharide deacetylase family protein, partial [Parvibaculaceae bacterium]|nr:divergent polysaccharide deacetylase family protein [Parvibaculaceae bacterium]